MLLLLFRKPHFEHHHIGSRLKEMGGVYFTPQSKQRQIDAKEKIVLW
jgi:hypothetical protein